MVYDKQNLVYKVCGDMSIIKLGGKRAGEK